MDLSNNQYHKNHPLPQQHSYSCGTQSHITEFTQACSQTVQLILFHLNLFSQTYFNMILLIKPTFPRQFLMHVFSNNKCEYRFVSYGLHQRSQNISPWTNPVPVQSISHLHNLPIWLHVQLTLPLFYKSPLSCIQLICYSSNAWTPSPLQVQVTAALVHSCGMPFSIQPDELCFSEPIQTQEPSSIERLPEENVSIVETLEGREERPETVRAITNGTARRKLYFNPAFFEPELLIVS